MTQFSQTFTVADYGASGATSGSSWMYHNVNGNWASVRASSEGGYVGPSFSSGTGLNTGGGAGIWGSLTRCFFVFDTSDIPDDATLVSATLRVNNNNSLVSVGISGQSLVVVEFTGSDLQTSNPPPGTDWTAWNTTAWSDAVLINSSLGGAADDGWAEIPLNATGLAAVSKTGVTKLALLLEADRANSEPYNNGSPGYQARLRVQLGAATNGPQLTVVWDSGVDEVTPTIMGASDTVVTTLTATTQETVSPTIFGVSDTVPLVTTSGGNTHIILLDEIGDNPIDIGYGVFVPTMYGGANRPNFFGEGAGILSSGISVTEKPSLRSPLSVLPSNIKFTKSPEDGMALTYLLRQRGHKAVNLTLATKVEAKAYDEDGNWVMTQTLAVDDNGKKLGRVQFKFFGNNFTAGGTYDLEFVITWPDGTQTYFPADEATQIYVSSSMVT